MNFLKAFGAAALKITALVLGLNLPVGGASGAIQVIVGHLGDLFKVIADVEAIGQALSLTGDQMLVAEVPKVSQLVLDALVAINPKFRIADEALYRDGVADVANGLAKILKSGHADGVDTKSLT